MYTYFDLLQQYGVNIECFFLYFLLSRNEGNEEEMLIYQFNCLSWVLS